MRWELEQRSPADLVSKLVTVHENPYSAAEDAHAIVVLTEWDEFKTLDYERIYKTMKHPASVFDGRLILDQRQLREYGFRLSPSVRHPTKRTISSVCHSIRSSLEVLSI
ncbi:UDP-glucose/GDP-mannose dehydrogenase family, UDP binding domain protein, partial [Ostertagia ostertagi]